MPQFGKAKEKIFRYLAKHAGNAQKGWGYGDAPDSRRQRQGGHSMKSILHLLEFGLTSNAPTLRDVEALSSSLGRWARQLIPKAISDTTLDTELRRLDSGYLLEKLVSRIRDAHRSKMLRPASLPFGVVTIDGKNLATLSHNADGTGHTRSSENAKWSKEKVGEDDAAPYWLMPALRATLTSAEAKPAIHQMPLPPGEGESSVFPAFVEALDKAYGRSGTFRVVDADAGLISLRNANYVVEKGYDYVFGLKGNQTELFAEANAVLQPYAQIHQPEAQTPWERRNGKLIRRFLYRTDELNGLENSVGKWTHLRQTWLVRQETKYNGQISVENRFFVTSLSSDVLTPHQILILVRNHWGVENDCFNSLDLQWREDDAPWCTRGISIWALGVLRLLSYNTAQLLRRRKLRKWRPDGRRDALMSWRILFKCIESALMMETETLPVGL